MKPKFIVALGAVFIASFLIGITNFNSTDQLAGTLSAKTASDSLRVSGNIKSVIDKIETKSDAKLTSCAGPNGNPNIYLAPNNPSGSVFVAGQSGATFLIFTLANNTPCDLVVDNISFTKWGMSSNSTVTNLYLYNGNNRLTNDGSINSNGIVNFSNTGIYIAANSTLDVRLVGDIVYGTSGQTVGFGITNFSVIDAISGTPLNPVSVNILGNTHMISSATLIISTLSATQITSSSAVLNGNFAVGAGNGTPSFSWSIAGQSIPQPTQTLPAQPNGNFSLAINNLLPNTTYNFKAFVYDPGKAITFFAPQILSFTTLPLLPDLVVTNLAWNTNSFTGATWQPVILKNTNKPTIYFRATVKNIGMTTATIPTGTLFTLYRNSISRNNVIGQYSAGVDGPIVIPPNDTTVILLTSKNVPNIRANAGTFQLFMEVDTTNKVQETNEKNNISQYALTVI